MKITKIKIDSMYGVEHLELDGKPVELRGAKGTGKTSVIDSIRLALTNRSERDYIVKNGEREGQIFIETDNGLSIDRKRRMDKGDYDKVALNGKPVQSQQSFINAIFTPLQLNPIEFASWDKNTQNRAILDLIEFDWDINWIKEQFGEIPSGIDYNQHILKVLDDIQSKKGNYWARREEANRKELYKRQQISDIKAKLPIDYDYKKWESYDLAQNIRALQVMRDENEKIDRAKAFIENYKNKVRGFDAEREIAISAEKDAIAFEKNGLMSTIERLKAELTAAEEKLLTLDEKLSDKLRIVESEYREKIAKLDSDISVARKYADVSKSDVSELQVEVENASKMKEFLSEYKSMLNMIEENKQYKAESEYCTSKIELARKLPGIVLQYAKIPVDGLTVQDGLPMIDKGNGPLPISNLSDGEKIELCIDITLQQTKKLELILLNGVESLDEDSRIKLYNKCRAAGVQIIAARTTDDNELTIYELEA